MLAGAVELPGSAAFASAHVAFATLAGFASAAALATAISSTTTATPAMGAILLRFM
jgi:hypothetical protein